MPKSPRPPNPNINAIRRRRQKTYPGDETKVAKGDHLGTTERAQGSLLDQGIYARAKRDYAREAESQGLAIRRRKNRGNPKAV